MLGPGFVVGVGNGLILGYLMYQSRLVPRALAALGLIGGPLICLSGAAVVLDIIGRGSAAQSIATAPEFVWELSLGISLTVKGFRPSPITSAMEKLDGGPASAPIRPARPVVAAGSQAPCAPSRQGEARGPCGSARFEP